MPAGTTPNMSLTTWDTEDDPYSYQQLLANWELIDAHDHTEGKGAPIPPTGIADGAITTDKIADGAVTTPKIADGAVTKAKLAAGVLGDQVGDVKMIWTNNPGTYTPPTGWVAAIGQALTAANHNFPGGGTVTLPDMRNRVPMGAALTGTGGGTGTPPPIGGTGGGHTGNLDHTHPVGAHTHGLPGHTHTINAHTHTVPSHAHTMAHDHWFYSPVGTEGANHVMIAHLGLELAGVNHMTDGDTTQIEDSLETVISIALGSEAPLVGAQDFRRYRIRTTDPSVANTGGSGTLTTSATALTTNSVSQSSQSSGANTGNPASSMANHDKRMAHVGLLFIIKVLT